MYNHPSPVTSLDSVPHPKALIENNNKIAGRHRNGKPSWGMDLKYRRQRVITVNTGWVSGTEKTNPVQ